MAEREASATDTLPIQHYGVEGGIPKKITSTSDGGKQRLDVSTGLATMPGFNISPYTRIDVTYPSSTQEVYAYTNGVTLVATITVNYTDATKNYILNAVKS